MRRCSERMASKAARQEPTGRGYHTGLYVEAREPPVVRCVLSRKMQGTRAPLTVQRKYQEGGVRMRRGTGSCLEKAWPVGRRAKRELRRRLQVRESRPTRNSGRSLAPRIVFQVDASTFVSPS